MAVPLEPPSLRPGHRKRNRIIVVVVVVVATMVALITIPITSSFSEQFGPYRLVLGPAPPYPSAIFDPPTGSHVWGTFSVNGTEAVNFQVFDKSANPVYSDNSTQGSFSFSASNPPYLFFAGPYISEVVSVSGYYSIPILFY